MIAILGGLGAAAGWALSTLCSSRSSRLIDPASVVAWVMLVGLVIAAPLAALEGVPGDLEGSSVVWLAASGAGNVGGLLMAYKALRVGQVALVSPIVSAEGAVAALIAVAAGETLGAASAVALVVIAAGIAMAAMPSAPRSAPEQARPWEAVPLALAAAVAFGISLYSTARAGDQLPAAWVVLSARLIGAVLLAVPLALLGRLRLTRQALPLVIVSGICEVLAFYSFIAGARHGIAVAAVLASQFAALAAVAAYFVFGERLARVQLAGVTTLLVGVAVLTALRA